jgi:chemotaxis response regulator CheB
MPDLILMDVVMPGMNGYQATRTISRDEATKHIPVIMCTSKGQETDKIWGMRQGANDYLVKPIDRKCPAGQDSPRWAESGMQPADGRRRSACANSRKPWSSALADPRYLDIAL